MNTSDSAASSVPASLPAADPLAGAMAAGAIFSVELALRADRLFAERDAPIATTSRGRLADHAPHPMPTFSSNDRSRWATVRALVDQGTWVIGRRDHELTLVTDSTRWRRTDRDARSSPPPARASHPERSRHHLRGRLADRGQVLNPDTLEFYSTKPPLCRPRRRRILAAEKDLRLVAHGERFGVVRVPADVQRPAVDPVSGPAGLAGRTLRDNRLGRIFVVTAGCFGTLLTRSLSR